MPSNSPRMAVPSLSARIPSKWMEAADYCEIRIRDTGIGIDPANHKIVFEKLYQLGKVELHSSGRTKFKGGGPGLGLAIAAGIVKAHKGRISGWKVPGMTRKNCLAVLSLCKSRWQIRTACHDCTLQDSQEIHKQKLPKPISTRLRKF